eukprot:XP_001706784.1 Hypothetical protein GL50803_33620 [Giardia lamblia ATCC 50803]
MVHKKLLAALSVFFPHNWVTQIGKRNTYNNEAAA